jgi:DNA-binding transcriptional ArsR family regulator
MRTRNQPARTTLWTAHRVRLRIYELLCKRSPTASRLGRRLRESRGSASHHLRMLAHAGVIAPEAADELGARHFALSDEVRRRPKPTGGSALTIVSISVVPVLS